MILILWKIWIKYLMIVLRCLIHIFLKVSVATVLSDYFVFATLFFLKFLLTCLEAHIT